MRIRVLASGLIGLVASLEVAWTAAPARACTCDSSPFYSYFTDPKDGGMNVPLNFAPVLMGSFVPGSVIVEDELGQSVDVTVNEGPAAGCPGTWAEIIPKQPWGPRTTYVVRVKPMYPEAGLGKDFLTFVTGVDSLPDSDLPTPKTRASLLTNLPGDGAACVSFSVKTCINVEGQTEDTRDIELIVRRGNQVLLRSLLWGNDADFGFANQPDCLELRRRGPTGKRSNPVTLCGKDLPAKALKNPSGGWQTWPECKDGVFKEQSSSASQGNPDLPKPDTSPAGSGGSQPPAADSEDDSQPEHREYGCATAPGAPGTRAPFAMLAAMASVFVRRRRAAKRS